MLWVLAAPAAGGGAGGLFAGYSAVKDAGRGTAWHLSLSGFALRALSEEELASYDPAREYYELEFELANNSERELQLDSYWFSVRPESGNKYAVQVVSGDDSAQFALRPVAPIGASTTVGWCWPCGRRRWRTAGCSCCLTSTASSSRWVRLTCPERKIGP